MVDEGGPPPPAEPDEAVPEPAAEEPAAEAPATPAPRPGWVSAGHWFFPRRTDRASLKPSRTPPGFGRIVEA